MATLLKVGNTFINLDTVTEIHSYELNGWNVIMYYTATGYRDDGEPMQDFEHFTGEDAEALRMWFERNSTDVLAWYRRQNNGHNGRIVYRDAEQLLEAF
ncbi:MAG: hypothetical protein HC837_04510 [Chloroflexaceae bacterium]|nr:hypothetical protein [Chloroflexaceae bacterium]